MSSESCPEAIVNLKSRLKTYAEHSTIKFLPRLIRAQSKIHKVLWVLTFIIGTSVASYLLAGLLKTYTSFEKTLSVTAEEGARPPFPDVTLCNLNPLWNHADGWGLLARVEGVPNALRYDQYIFLLYKMFHSSEGGGTSFDRTNPEMYSVSGYLKHTEYDQQTLDDLHQIFIWKCLWENGRTQEDCVINATITPTNGLCYTIRPPAGEGLQVKTREEGLSVILFLNNTNLQFVADYRLSPFESYTEGVKVYLHSRGTAPEMSRGFTVAPGTEASVVAKHHTRKLLKEPYGDCKEMELDTFKQFDPRSIWKYTQYTCRSLCYQDKIIEKCGCVDSTEITFDDIVARYRYCSIFSLTNPEKALEDLNCSREVKAELDANGTCNSMCSHPCQHTYYDTYINQVPWPSDIYILAFYYSYLRARRPSDEFKQYELVLAAALAGNTSEAWQMIKGLDLIKRNFLQLSVTMDDTMVCEEDKPAIAVSAIVGSLGGILNLYIGFNLITVADFLDFFLTLVIDYLLSRKAKVEQEKSTSKTPEPQVTTVEPFRI